LAAAALTALAGCVSAPDISISSVDVVEIGEAATELAVRIDLENPNDVPVKLDMWDYRFSIGSDAYSGRWSAGITVPPKEKVTASIPAVVPNSSTPGPASAWRTSGSVTFLAPSRLAEALFELGLNRPSASFSGNGTSIGSAGAPPNAG